MPAVEVVAVHHGDVVLADAFGFRDLEAQSSASPHTLFHHGSTGKAFTGVLAGTLVDAGLLDWDRPIRDYLPDFRLQTGMLDDRITTADLLSHRSGLARHEVVWLANPSLDRGELVRRLRYLSSNIEPRTTFVYSNLAYVTVGHLIGVLTGSTWEDQMRERVLQPLGMSHTQTSVAGARALEHAQPYMFKVDRPEVATPETVTEARVPRGQWSAIPWRQSDQIAPAGGIITCAVDTVRWLQLQLSDGEVDGKRIISAESLARTRHLHTPIDVPGPDPDDLVLRLCLRLAGGDVPWPPVTVAQRRDRRLQNGDRLYCPMTTSRWPPPAMCSTPTFRCRLHSMCSMYSWA